MFQNLFLEPVQHFSALCAIAQIAKLLASQLSRFEVSQWINYFEDLDLAQL
jgi:hypothetical protein